MMRVALENSWAWTLGLPAAVAGLALFVWALRRRGHSRGRTAALATLRVASLLLLLLLASRPVWVGREPLDRQRNQVVLLIDRSESMSLVDDGRTRYVNAVALARRELLPALKALELQVEPYLFAEDAEAVDGPRIANSKPDGKATDLARAIVRTVAQAEPPPLAIVALTDGAVTEDRDNARAVASLVDSHVPFVGIGFGRESGTPVLSLEQAVAPEVVSSNQQFRVSAQLRATAASEIPDFSLVLLRDGRFVQKKTITAGSGPRVWQESFQVTEPAEGYATYTVQLQRPADPSVKCPTTQATAIVRIADEKHLRVLFLQGGLTWDYKFIRLALTGDPTIKLSGLSRTASNSTFFQNVENDTDLVGGFPSTLDELANFRVVVLANLKPGDLTLDQQELLARFCGEYGGGVLMIGGASTFNAPWDSSRLEQLLPVRFAPVSPHVAGSEPFPLKLTAAATRHPAFRISDVSDNRGAWARLPSFTNYAAVDSVKPGAEVWIEHPRSVGGSNHPPLMAVQRYGSGHSAVICVQNFWRWRLAKETNTEHFDRFWRQLLRYLAEGGRDSVTLVVADQQLEPHIDIRVLLEKRPDPGDMASAPGQYNFRVEDDQHQVVADQSVELRAGRAIEVTFVGNRTGLFPATVLDKRGVVQASRSIDIRDVGKEFVDTSRYMESLRQWARVSDGIAAKSENCQEVAEFMATVKTSAERRRREAPRTVPAGINGWMLALLLSCVCGDWMLRKRWGLT